MPNVTAWLLKNQPDVLLLQEIKCETAAFPRLEFSALGYSSSVAGQKGYNGVAILSRSPATDVIERISGDESDQQARYIEATVEGVRVASVYLPNGNPLESEKFPYKLAWMARLEARVRELLQQEIPFVLGGDYNVIPEEQDVHDPKGWEKDALYHPKTRAAFRRILHAGAIEAFRALHPRRKHAYTFWDYKSGAWERGTGLRIDHFLLSPEAADRMSSCEIDPSPRGLEKASDHAPVTVCL